MKQVEWRFDVVSSEPVSGEPGTPGARYTQLVKQGRKRVTSEVEVTEAAPPRGVIDARVAIEPHGFLKLFEPFMGPALRKTSARYEAALAERLEGTPGK